MSAAEEIMIVEHSEQHPLNASKQAERNGSGDAIRVPVNALWRKGTEFDLRFINRQRFNQLRFRFLIHRNRPVALKTGVDNPRATL
jgi:hypothetical protein